MASPVTGVPSRNAKAEVVVLVELRLKNLAVAADVRLPLGPGLNVVTGSTGAGKSLAVEALRWLRGEPIDKGLLRAGADKASAEALFDLSDRPDLVESLDAIGVEVAADGMLRLRREVRREGRSRAWIDTQVSSAGVLREVTDRLVHLQSQHQQLSLLEPREHLGLLDALGVDETLRRDWASAWSEWREVQRLIAEAEERRRRLRDQQDVAEFQYRELEGIGLQEGELETLRRRVAVLEGGARLGEAVAGALSALDAEDAGALAALRRAVREMRQIPEEVDDLVEVRDRLASALDLADESARELQAFLDSCAFDPEETAHAQARLAELLELTRKYARTEPELIEFRDRLGRELAEIDDGDALPAELRARLSDAERHLQTAAVDLDRARRSAARRAARAASPLLDELGMEGSALRFDQVEDVDPKGEIEWKGRRLRVRSDGPVSVRLSVRTNRGEAFGPVERVASGGELSRIGLVLRSLAVQGRRPALLLLDEVDAGLGADLGPALARRLRALADAQPLMVVTHLPAVAAAADRHLVVRKDSDSDRTSSEVEWLRGNTREQELARMLGGEGERTRRVARELLAAAAAGGR